MSVTVPEIGRLELLPLRKRLLAERLPTVAGNLLLRVDGAVAPDADIYHITGLHRSIESVLVLEMRSEFFARPRDRVTASDVLRDAIAFDALDGPDELRRWANRVELSIAFDVKLRRLGAPPRAAANAGLQLRKFLRDISGDHEFEPPDLAEACERASSF